MDKPVLEVKNITKRFGSVEALSQINFSIGKGEIYGLVGANGSGKSTLMNILSGNSIIRDTGGYSGEIYIEGERVVIGSMQHAVRQGIGMIHQEFVLIPDMSVSENINLTREHKHPLTKKLFGSDLAYLDKQKDQARSRAILRELGFEIEESLLVKNLSVHARQFIEIGREMNKDDLKILFLDEPTAVLNEQDSRKLMEILTRLAGQGVAILFCTHRLHEICQICDRVSVLRDGSEAAVFQKHELEVSALAKAMVGYDVTVAKRQGKQKREEKILEFQDFAVSMPGELLQGVNLDVFQGEVLGVTSLSGHGKYALGYGAMGLYESTGSMQKNGVPALSLDVQKNMDNGLFLLPDDRKQMGLLLEHSIRENIVFSGFYGKQFFTKKLFGRWSIKDKKAMDRYINEQIENLEIKCTSPQQKASELSGGNQQKVCIARANGVDAEVLFVMEPTRGVDIGAKEKILDLLLEMNEKKGTTIVVSSSELEELRRICDRIVVFCEGRVAAILPPDASEEMFALAYTGEEASYGK